MVSKNSNLETRISKILCSGYYVLANYPQNKLSFLDNQSLPKEEKVKKLLTFFEEDPVDQERAFEEYLQTWRINHQYRRGMGTKEEEILKIKTEHKSALATNEKAVDELMKSLIEKFKPLENKLLLGQTATKAYDAVANTVATAVHKVIDGLVWLERVNRGMHREEELSKMKLKSEELKSEEMKSEELKSEELKREEIYIRMFNQEEHNRDVRSSKNDRMRNPTWFKETQTFLVDYILGKESDDSLREFLEKERLEDDFHHFQDCVCPWARDLEQKMEIINFRPLLIASVEAELNRMEKFVFALVLNDSKHLKEHQELVADVMNSTVNLSTEDFASIFPSFSFGQLPLQDGNKQRVIRLRFVLDQSCTHQHMKTMLESKFENIKMIASELINNQNVVVLDVEINGSDSKFIAKHIAVLSDLSIRGILIGSFGIGMGDGVGSSGIGMGDGTKSSDSKFRHCMNPKYNKIYSRRMTDQAEGFIPTWFTCLDRGGEPYFCPEGWRRYGIDVGMTSSQFEAAYGDWPVAYHGTAGHLAWTILLSGLQASGSGVYLDAGEGGVYLSPSIEYCGHPRYSTIWKIKNQYVQMVLQVRVKKWGPNKQLNFIRMPETLLKPAHKSTVIDSNFKNDEMEWIIGCSPGEKISSLDGLLVYGLMLRVTDKDPRNLPQCNWWANSDGVPNAFE
jgi:hypothetical protein